MEEELSGPASEQPRAGLAAEPLGIVYHYIMLFIVIIPCLYVYTLY